MLNHPGHTRRYRRFAGHLTVPSARLAMELVVNLSSHRTFTDSPAPVSSALLTLIVARQ